MPLHLLVGQALLLLLGLEHVQRRVGGELRPEHLLELGEAAERHFYKQFSAHSKKFSVWTLTNSDLVDWKFLMGSIFTSVVPALKTVTAAIRLGSRL